MRRQLLAVVVYLASAVAAAEQLLEKRGGFLVDLHHAVQTGPDLGPGRRYGLESIVEDSAHLTDRVDVKNERARGILCKATLQGRQEQHFTVGVSASMMKQVIIKRGFQFASYPLEVRNLPVVAKAPVLPPERVTVGAGGFSNCRCPNMGNKAM